MDNRKRVGIVTMEAYFSPWFVSQDELEDYYRISKGKFTKGLGQVNMAFSSDREDSCSMALTVFSKLMEKNNLSYDEIGRLEVATETIQDQSKSIKSHLMELFKESKNFNVEGVDVKNACYGGTSALFNSIAWVESSDWNGKYAVVICSDIAEYQKGPASPTSGSGTIAILIGENPILALEPKCRFSFMRHAFDFYKPHMDSHFPVVDGRLSNLCYLQALENCYMGFTERFRRSNKVEISAVIGGLDYFAFHCPYCKLVQKSLARIVFVDFLKYPKHPFFNEKREFLEKFERENSYESKELMVELQSLSKSIFEDKVSKSTEFSKELGNSYTASVFFSILSLLANTCPSDLKNKRLAVFAFGSGMTSSMYLLRFCGSTEAIRMGSAGALRAKERLSHRRKMAPRDFDRAVEERQRNFVRRSFEPKDSLADMEEDTFYLKAKDELGRRWYSRVGGE